MQHSVIVAGSREGFPDYLVQSILTILFPDGCRVISGMARGVDRAGYEWAKSRGYDVVMMPAAWRTDYGVDYTAGAQRNRRMAAAGDLLVAFWDGRSTGTKDMITVMRALGKPCIVITWERPDESWALDRGLTDVE